MKKLLYLSVMMGISVSLNAQSRSSLQKEIKQFKNKIYLTQMIQTSTDTLKWVIYDHMKAQDYQLQKVDTNYYTYYKRVPYPGRRTHRVESYVYIQILNRGLLKKVEVSTDEVNYVEPHARSVQPDISRPVNIKVFDEKAFYHFLYLAYNKNDIPLSDELRKKVETFNAKQNKHKKKLIAGRDY